jgi:hypothetical protein
VTTSSGGYFLPKICSCRAVSAADWNFTVLPSRMVNTSTWSADFPSEVVRGQDDDPLPVSQEVLGVRREGVGRKDRPESTDLLLPAVGAAHRAVARHDPFGEVGHGRRCVAGGKRRVRLLHLRQVLLR